MKVFFLFNVFCTLPVMAIYNQNDTSLPAPQEQEVVVPLSDQDRQAGRVTGEGHHIHQGGCLVASVGSMEKTGCAMLVSGFAS